MTATPTDAKIAAICAPLVQPVNPFGSSCRAARLRTMRYLGNGLRTGRAEGMERIKLGDKFPNALARKL